MKTLPWRNVNVWLLVREIEEEGVEVPKRIASVFRVPDGGIMALWGTGSDDFPMHVRMKFSTLEDAQREVDESLVSLGWELGFEEE